MRVVPIFFVLETNFTKTVQRRKYRIRKEGEMKTRTWKICLLPVYAMLATYPAFAQGARQGVEDLEKVDAFDTLAGYAR